MLLAAILDDKNKRETIGKRPGPPPPLGKKPGKNADPKLMAQTDDHKAQEQQTGLYIGTGLLGFLSSFLHFSLSGSFVK